MIPVCTFKPFLSQRCYEEVRGEYYKTYFLI